MGWHMKLVICVQLAYVSVCLTQLSVVREWTSWDVQSSPGDGQESRSSILPTQVNSWLLYKDRMFVTFYRGWKLSLAYLDLTGYVCQYVSVCLTQLSAVHEWTSLDKLLKFKDGRELGRSIKHSDVYFWVMYKDKVFVTLSGQPYSLAYLDLTDNSSQLLRPYPSYENLLLIDLDKVRVDHCNRLWIFASFGLRYNIIVFDLKTDSILRNSTIPGLVYSSYDIIIDDFDCDNEYVYISVYGGVSTYSWAEGDSWCHLFTDIMLMDEPRRITSMKLAPNSIVYFNVAHKPIVYYMSTTLLKDKSVKSSDSMVLNWSGKMDVYLYSSALDAKNDVLYYFNDDNKTVIHAVPCWTSERCSSNCQDVSIDPTHQLKYITVDENGYLWAITSTYHFKDGEINFRIFSLPVKSTCLESNANDTKNTITDVEPNAKDTTNTTNINESTTPASSATEQTSTLGSVPKHTTVNIADTTAGTPNSNITQAVGATNMPYLLFSLTNTTFNLNLSNFTITNNYFH